MKTVEQAAGDCATRSGFKSDFPHDERSVEYGFLEGVKFAQEWINVEDELPQVPDAQNSINPFFIIAKDSIKHGYATIRIDASIDIKFLKNNFTHWRPIEII